MKSEFPHETNPPQKEQQPITEEAHRLKSYKKQTSRLDRLSLVMKQINEGIIDYSLKDCLLSLMKDPSQRSLSEITPIKKFILQTELASKFRMDNILEEHLEDLVSLISTEMKHFFLEKGKTLFHIGDIGDNFYIIVHGKVSVLIPNIVKEQMTGFQFYTHIMTLYLNNENYLLKQTLDYNTKLLNIHRADLDELSLIVFRLCLEDYFARVNYAGKTLQEISQMCFVPSFYFDDIITSEIEDITDPLKLKKEEAELFERLSKYSEHMTKQYRILVNDSIKFNVSIPKYKSKIYLEGGNYFGDVALDQYTTRNATIRTEEDTHFCYIDYTHYNNCLRYEKQKLNIKEISFIVDNYFFKSMQYKDFEKKIFVSFKSQELLKNSYICRENEPTNYLYFISDGQIELTMYKSMSDIYELLFYLRQLLKSQTVNNRILTELPKDPCYKKLPMKIKEINKIFVLNHIELIGLESLFFGLNYLYSARVVSERAKFFKIEVESVLQLLNDKSQGKELKVNYRESAVKKMKIFMNRLHDLYDLKLDMYNRKYKINIGKLLIETENPENKRNNSNTQQNSYNSSMDKKTYEYCSNMKLVFKNNNILKHNGSHLNNKLLQKIGKTNQTLNADSSTDTLPVLSSHLSQNQLISKTPHSSRLHEGNQTHVYQTEEYKRKILSKTNKGSISIISFHSKKKLNHFKSDNMLLSKIKQNKSREQKYNEELIQNKNHFKDGVDINLNKTENHKYILKDPLVQKITRQKNKFKQHLVPKYPAITNINLNIKPNDVPSEQNITTIYQRYRYMKIPKFKLKFTSRLSSLENSSNVDKSSSNYNSKNCTVVNKRNHLGLSNI